MGGIEQRIKELEYYTSFELPKLTHLQVSDFFQEFLNINDMYKLMDYDNKKLFMM
jgi:hypothetical protein